MHLYFLYSIYTFEFDRQLLKFNIYIYNRPSDINNQRPTYNTMT